MGLWFDLAGVFLCEGKHVSENLQREIQLKLEVWFLEEKQQATKGQIFKEAFCT